MIISIGYAFDTPSGVVDLAEEGVRSLFPEETTRTKLFTLAGPNDTLQLIADAPTWAKVVLAIYGTEIVKEIAKETWKERARIAKAAGNVVQIPLKKVVTALGGMKHRLGATAALVVPVSVASRGAGIDIPVLESDEITWRMQMMARHADAIKEFVEELGKDPKIVFEMNPDMRTIKVTPNDDGSVTISWRLMSGSEVRSTTIK